MLHDGIAVPRLPQREQDIEHGLAHGDVPVACFFKAHGITSNLYNDAIYHAVVYHDVIYIVKRKKLGR